jgi:hypothetical protein
MGIVTPAAHQINGMFKGMGMCNKCKKSREDSDFNANAHQKTGRQPWCRECTTAYSRRWYELNKQKHITYVREHDRRPRKRHLCKHCGLGEPDVKFYIKKQGERFYRRFMCFGCDAIYKQKYPSTEAATKRENARKAARGRISRKDETLRCMFILRDSKRADKMKGRDNDLDREFIRKLIDEGCAYCADHDARMTLDRIDNDLGHLKTNVVASCMRCNYFRRDMPHAAWIMVAPKIRQARLLGLLEGWNSGTIKSQRKTTAIDIEVLREI